MTSKGLALALQANDPHTNDFTLAILHLHENYVLDNLKRKWWETNNRCPQEQETSKTNVELEQYIMNVSIKLVLSCWYSMQPKARAHGLEA